MEYELSLSDKGTEVRINNFVYYSEEDIKEFIKRLKEEIESNSELRNIQYFKIIDILAGKKLI